MKLLFCIALASIQAVSADDRLGMKYSFGGVEYATGGKSGFNNFAHDGNVAAFKSLAYRRDLACMENSAVSGRRDETLAGLDYLSHVLSLEDRFASVSGTAFMRKGMMDLEYALARIINDRRPSTVKLSVHEVRKSVPRFSSSDFKDTRVCAEMDTFRVMLIIGALIEERFRKDGCLPAAIEELVCETGLDAAETRDAWGRKIRYVKLGETDWKLYSGGANAASDIGEGSDFIPGLDDVEGYVDGGIWFSSKYSARRLELLENGSFKGGSVYFDCSLTAGGMIHRGRPRTRRPLKTK